MKRSIIDYYVAWIIFTYESPLFISSQTWGKLEDENIF